MLEERQRQNQAIRYERDQEIGEENSYSNLKEQALFGGSDGYGLQTLHELASDQTNGSAWPRRELDNQRSHGPSSPRGRVVICRMNDSRRVTALALLSGGLDSSLAVRLILDQGIKVTAMKFTSPFCLCDQNGRCHAKEIAEKSNVPLQIVGAGADYLEILRNPKYGYGSGMNPCIDCRIYMLRKSKIYAQSLGVHFIFTGEVLDERPMSQHRRALEIIEKESCLEGKILRPLSAKLLPETEAERKGWVDRNKLLDIRGRSRRRQIELAKELKLSDYPCPAGGCLLTYREFARKIKDLLEHKDAIDASDLLLLRLGRHFRAGESKMTVGRDEMENAKLKALARTDDYLFEVSGCGSPLTLLQGPKTEEAIEAAAALTARYSDSTESKVRVKYGSGDLRNWIIASPINEDLIDRLRI